jgi:transcriptional regulator with XRE-family HTH domain|nr:MAG TPA: helix-turn-helix domain protein [Caudoviricetes sp.]DAV89424.1 MAG TPA: helix-turn-helix domain protein [Caudoviricetes sp.]
MTNLQRLRLAAELSQSQLASKSGVNVRMIQQYECKNRNINKAQFETVCKLASALSVKAEDLREIDE